MTSKDMRAAVKRDAGDLRDFINEWDPLGLLELGAPKDEYECLVGPILSHLARGVSAAELQTWLESHIADHFGVASDPAGPFVEKVVTWYGKRGGAA